MSDDQAVSRGHRAFNELEETAHAFEAVRSAILMTLADTPVGQDAKVLKLHMALQNLAGVQQALRAVIDNGLVAQAAIAQAGLTRPN